MSAAARASRTLDPPSPPDARAPSSLSCALLAVTLAGGLHLYQRRVGFWYQDEGYLWYGVQAVLRGELPLRDFNSYDPGRYLWCAAWGLVLGPGILALRLACALFGALGLFFGLRVAARVLPQRWLLLGAGAVLALWMQPPWKVFESALAMTAVFFGARLVERPDARRHLAAGVFVGAAACFGRNHGVYTALGFAVLIAVVWLRGERTRLARRLAAWAVGVVLGYAPMLALVALAPGFPAAFVESIVYFAQQGHLAGKKPVPWPWRVDHEQMDLWGDVRNLAVGCTYLLLYAYYALALPAVACVRFGLSARRAAWLSATILGAPYVHHASVHAAYNHLAQACHPLMLALLALPAALGTGPARLARGLVVGSLLVLAVAANVTGMEATLRLRQRGTPMAMRELRVGHDVLDVRPDQGLYMLLLVRAVQDNVPDDEPVFLAPVFPGIYCMLGREAPTWDVYLAWLGTARSQERLVRELAAVDWALVADVRPGGQEWMRLSNTNPAAWELLQREFEEVALTQRMPRGHVLLRRKRP